MTLSDRLHELCRAGFTGIWVESQEPEDAVGEIARLCQREGYALGLWDIARGVYSLDTCPVTAQMARLAPQTEKAPGKILATIAPASRQVGSTAPLTVWVLHNFHVDECLGRNTLHRQMLLNLLLEGKRIAPREGAYRIILLGPTTQIPLELRQDIVTVTHALPSRDELWRIVETLVPAEELPDEAQQRLILDAGAGMTRRNFEDAVSLSLIRIGRIQPATIWELKSQQLLAGGLLKLHQGPESFESLCGLTHFKDFTRRLLQPRDNVLLRPKGLLLLGVWGAGKSSAVYALGNATGRRVLEMSMASLRDKYVGESEKNIEQALATADAMEPCVLLLDEVEKALAGVGSEGGGGDSGLGSRIFGQLLTWLQNHTSDVFVVCTCNDISQLPPEFSRAERFDGIFFFDTPTHEERQVIWEYYVEYYQTPLGTDLDNLVRLSDDWTGAEIRTCCRLAAMLGSTAREQLAGIVPVSRSASEALQRLRSWASQRCLSASYGGIYGAPSTPTPVSSSPRRVLRRPAPPKAS